MYIVQGKAMVYTVQGKATVYTVQGKVTVFTVQGKVTVYILQGKVTVYILQGKVTVSALAEYLDDLKAKGTSLTVRSLKFISLPQAERAEFANLHRDAPLKKQV